MNCRPWAVLTLVLFTTGGNAQRSPDAKRLAVIGYYAGRTTTIDSFPTQKLTHIIYSFCHLRGNRLYVNNAGDSDRIRHLVTLKENNPGLRVILSLGGWGGCRTCPDVFATDSGRREFAASVREISDYFHTDGIDLDWEYPSLENVPGYPYTPEDKDHFTEVIRLLRKTLGRKAEISFAAGGFTTYLETSVDWKKVAPLVNYINLMTYDLVGGYSKRSGHHTPLYSTPDQAESVDHAVSWLDSAGVPRNKLVIGMAFYARIYQVDDSAGNGLYQPARFWRGVSYRDQPTILSPDSGYVYHWDSVAQAPYKFNAQRRLFATFDDTVSIRLKTE
ncbi:MAG TPA: glycosyl hydrolase family 18 protein, partial [Puia sp.]|nr:glycosyl hydrolase family 18 protein [Puia sp.]